jgi:hypothetical protein
VGTRFPLKCSANDFLGFFSLGINSTSQTTTVGKKNLNACAKQRFENKGFL